MAVQQASLRGNAIGFNRALERKKEASRKALEPVLRGYFTSACAQWGADSVAQGIACLTASLHEWELETGHTIAGQIAIKRRNGRWGL